MVFDGRPSKACERCRQRRKKCDLGRPECRKCQALGLECPGYRNAQDLIFRNVTEEVIGKHFMAQSALVKEPSSALSTPSLRLNEGVLQVALTFLFQCYLRGSSFDWVQDVYRDSSEDSLFTEVVKATALASYSYESHRKPLLTQARRLYDHALLRLRKDVEGLQMLSVNILACVLLMSRFETLLDDGNQASVTENWLGHVSGAFSILQSRPEEGSFAEPLSYILYEQTLHNYNLYCVRMTQLRPPSLITATEKLAHWLCGRQESAIRLLRLQLHELSDKVVRCRLNIRKADAESLVGAVHESLASDQEALAFMKKLTEAAAFEVKAVSDFSSSDDSNFDFQPRGPNVHIYRSHQHARIWNSLRMLRINLHIEIVEQSERVLRGARSSANTTTQDLDTIQRSTRLLREICTEICASAPQYLRTGSSDCTHAAASYMVLPLFVAARVDKPGCRDFVTNALLWIGHELRIKSAHLAVEALDALEYNDDWLLATYSF